MAAICAAPTALKAHEIAKGKKITSYPAFKDALKDDYDYQEVTYSHDQYKFMMKQCYDVCFSSGKSGCGRHCCD